MKKIKKLNFQLFLTIVVLVVGSIIAFAIILPTSSRHVIDNKIYKMIIESQDNLIYNEGQNNEVEGIYHILHNNIKEAVDNEVDEKLLHQKIMYKSFFKEVDKKVLTEQKLISNHKYVQGDQVIYYIINKSYPSDILISYKIDDSSKMLSHQLFMNILVIATITISIILIIFLKWNKRLINNLKDIQLKLDYIGEGNLKNTIKVDNYTVEFKEVMQSLETMRQKLYENEQVKQDMVHNISHDLKTPLAVIKNYAEGIIDGVYPYGTVEETAHVIYNQADRLQKRVQGLLYLNKLEYMRSQKEIHGKFNMRELVLEVVAYMQDIKQIETYLDISYFVGDIEKWRVVLENLIDNAKRYAQHQIIIKVENEKLTIYNDGAPIEECINGSLFKPFEVGRGGVTGLGLSIVKKTVELYNYDIDFVNEPKGGVTFIICKIT